MTTTEERSATATPRIASAEAWAEERARLLEKEKAATRLSDELAAERRRLPMVRIEEPYVFEGPEGRVTLLDLFEGRRQLIVYHFMLQPGGKPCEGCSMFIDNLGHLAHLHARDTSFVVTAPAPLPEIEALKARMGWTVPWVSQAGNRFQHDMGAGDGFGLSVFLRQGDEVYRSYFTTKRAAEKIGTVWSLLDLTPYGRQETWEDSPDGWPQSSPYIWWRLHDEYES